MRSFALIPLLATPVFADYATDLLGALNGLGLTTFSSVLKNASATDGGKGLVSLLAQNDTKYTVFAPSNQGFAGAFKNATTIDATAPGLINTLKYHVVSGSLQNYTANFPNTTIGRTYLNASNLVQLEGGKSQVVAWSHYADGNTYVMNQNTPAKIVNQTVWQNLEINIVDAVLDTPGNISNALVANNLTVLEGILRTAGILDYLNNQARGFTLFAPQDAVLAAATANATIAASLANKTTLATVLGNHLVNGSTIYSSNLANNATSASGQPLTAGSNHSLTSGSSVVQIVTPDILLKNGVIHVINGVLLNTESNTGAASAAYQSATSVAGTAPATTETAPIGNTATFSQTGSGANPSSSSGSGSGGSNGAMITSASRAAVAVSVLGALAGAVLTLA